MIHFVSGVRCCFIPRVWLAILWSSLIIIDFVGGKAQFLVMTLQVLGTGISPDLTFVIHPMVIIEEQYSGIKNYARTITFQNALGQVTQPLIASILTTLWSSSASAEFSDINLSNVRMIRILKRFVLKIQISIKSIPPKSKLPYSPRASSNPQNHTHANQKEEKEVEANAAG